MGQGFLKYKVFKPRYLWHSDLVRTSQNLSPKQLHVTAKVLPTFRYSSLQCWEPTFKRHTKRRRKLSHYPTPSNGTATQVFVC